MTQISTAESQYTTRNATLEDIDDILALDARLFPEGSYMGPRQLRNDIQEHAPSVKLAMYEDEIVGCVQGGLHASRLIPGRPYGDIMTIGVDEAHRRHGLGRLLLSEMIDEIKKESPTGIVLHTRVSNIAMQGLAQQFNFTTENQIEDYYIRTRVPEDAYQMVLRFD